MRTHLSEKSVLINSKVKGRSRFAGENTYASATTNDLINSWNNL